MPSNEPPFQRSKLEPCAITVPRGYARARDSCRFDPRYLDAMMTRGLIVVEAVEAPDHHYKCYSFTCGCARREARHRGLKHQWRNAPLDRRGGISTSMEY